MDPQLLGGCTMVALVDSEHFLEKDPFELSTGQFQRDASMHHLGYEASQLLTHRRFSINRIGRTNVSPG
jgi:ABC-type Fe3+/spermidine/putrescine transport system ATPase subunit